MAEHDTNLCGISPECPGCVAERWKAILATLREMAAADPEQLRAVLSSVFDVQAMVEQSAFAKRVSQEALTMASNAKLAANEAAARIDSVHAGIDHLAVRITRGNAYVNKLSERVAKAFAFLRDIRSKPSGTPPAGKANQPGGTKEK